MTPQDLNRLVFLAELAPGPGGGVIFTETRIAAGEVPRYERQLWLWSAGGLRQLTRAGGYSPQYLENRVYFLRRVDEVPQLFVLDLNGGEPEQLTRFKSGVEDYQVSPSGRYQAVLTRGDWQKPASGTPRRYRNLPYKFNGAGLLPEVPRQLYILAAGQEPRQVGEFPQGVSEFCWSGDETGFALTSSPTAQDRVEGRGALYWLGLNGESELLYAPSGPVYDPVFSPDSQTIYFLSHAYERAGGTIERLFSYRRDSGACEWPEQLDFCFGPSLGGDCHYGRGPKVLTIGPGGELLALVTEHGRNQIYRLEPGQPPLGLLAPDTGLVGWAYSGGELFTLAETNAYPARLYRGGEVLYDPNPDFAAQPAQELAVELADHNLQGYALLPEGKGPFPAVLYIHGGPYTSYGQAFNLEFQLLRQKGIAVIYTNPRGSSGYGQDFADLAGKFGEIDQFDLLAFLDHCLANLPLDHERIGIAGGSYGGFMTNWLTSNFPERFRAAVSERGICNWLSMWGASDIGPHFTETQILSGPHQDPETLWQKSPLRLAAQVKTPTLVIHSEEDHRCPIDQGETWFTALWLAGTCSEFLRFAEENHELSRSGRPDRRTFRLEAILDWFGSHLETGSASG